LGKQQDVFGIAYEYVRYVAAAKRANKKLIAVVDEGDELPNRNAGIDRVIIRFKNQTTLSDIAKVITGRSNHYD
jgi:hypothetical protein